MTKLIDAYLANPNEKTRNRLIQYVIKHPFATCLATPEQTAVLKSLEA